MICVLTSHTSVTAEVSSMAAVALVSLIIFLAAKEICGVSEDQRLRGLSRCLDVAVVPLLAVFAAVLVARVQSSLL